MLEATFYVLTAGYNVSRGQFACRLAEKAYRSGQWVLIYTANQQQSQSIDDLLWTFRPTSFVPHQIAQPQQLPTIPQVLICQGFLPSQSSLTVLNLSQDVPSGVERCERVLEILDETQEAEKVAARQRYRQYQQLGANLVSHRMTA